MIRRKFSSFTKKAVFEDVETQPDINTGEKVTDDSGYIPHKIMQSTAQAVYDYVGEDNGQDQTDNWKYRQKLEIDEIEVARREAEKEAEETSEKLEKSRKAYKKSKSQLKN